MKGTVAIVGNGKGPRPASVTSASFAKRWACLAFGTLWAILAMLVILNLHVNPEDLRNIESQPVMHTVYARDSGLWLANFLTIGSAIVVAAVELAIRTRHKSDRPGVIAFVLGSTLCAYSLFGWLYGLAAIAPIGVMVIVSGVSVSRQTQAVTQAAPKYVP